MGWVCQLHYLARMTIPDVCVRETLPLAQLTLQRDVKIRNVTNWFEFSNVKARVPVKVVSILTASLSFPLGNYSRPPAVLKNNNKTS